MTPAPLAPFAVREQANLELHQEAFRAAVDAEKIKIRSRRTFWSRLFPFTLTFTRKNP